MANLAAERLLHELLVEGEFDRLQDRLNCVRTPLVATYLCKFLFDEVEHVRALLNCTILEKLLAEVVSVPVHHDNRQVLADILQNKLDKSAVGL